MELSKLSANKLEAAYNKAFNRNCDTGKRCIAAGMGNWRPTERDAALRGEAPATPDQLALAKEWRDNAAAFRAIVDEQDERKRWHGSMKPINRKGF